MKTVRNHSKGEPFTRTVPDGCKTKTNWQREGFILKPDARPTAWILMMDNAHEYAVFSSDQVEPGTPPPQPPKVSHKALEKLFLEYKALEPRAELYQDYRHYWIDVTTGQRPNGKLEYTIINLSGRYDERAGRLHPGSRAKAYERLKELIAQLKAIQTTNEETQGESRHAAP